jgi:hypothetical protein
LEINERVFRRLASAKRLIHLDQAM